MKKIIMLTLSVALVLNYVFSQRYVRINRKYVFENKAVYSGYGFINGRLYRGKFIIYWSLTNPSIAALNIKDPEGLPVGLTIIDKSQNLLFLLDLRENTGIKMKLENQSQTSDNKNILKLDTSQTQTILGINCKKYLFSTTQKTQIFWIGENLPRSRYVFKLLDLAKSSFIDIPADFKGVIMKYQEIEPSGNILANYDVQDIQVNKYYVFDLNRFKIIDMSN